MAGDKSSEVGYVKGTASHLEGSFIASENFSSSKDRASLSINVDIDCSDTIKGLKTIQREAKKATAALKELSNEQTKEHMLVIKLDEMGSVPKVFYKGEEVSNKINVGFNWETLTDKTDGRSDIRINYYVLDSVGKSTEKKIRESRNQS